MNKKQAGIILTLLALIVSAALLSAKINGKLDDGTGNLSETIAFNQNKAQKGENNSKNDYFYEARNSREQSNATTVETLKQISNDNSATKENKENASKQLTEMTIAKNNQTKIELEVKAKGFDDALCFIDKDKVKVIVKSKDELTEKQSIQIQDVVKNITGKSNVMIERKQ
ncbi:MAG: SpoIIIAH-like family protein [Inconstantimicrobium porci]|nr:SpoIIIAH-like family protein [Inconstantimicrobium porci]MDD6771885.1 SpoIIIAH-like family protein [Inconstantimicrobium porci]MDY5913414.1 SpoIIIAH-like family protein [Inconstantimicrobium porci]